jgi:hypothetical protein
VRWLGFGFSTISAFARMHIIWGDAFVPASPRSASSCAERCFYLPGLMKRNERVADLIEKAGREEAELMEAGYRDHCCVHRARILDDV